MNNLKIVIYLYKLCKKNDCIHLWEVPLFKVIWPKLLYFATVGSISAGDVPPTLEVAHNLFTFHP